MKLRNQLIESTLRLQYSLTLYHQKLSAISKLHKWRKVVLKENKLKSVIENLQRKNYFEDLSSAFTTLLEHTEYAKEKKMKKIYMRHLMMRLD